MMSKPPARKNGRSHASHAKTRTKKAWESRQVMLSGGIALLGLTIVLVAITFLLPQFTTPSQSSTDAAAALLASSTPTAPPGPDAYLNISLIGKAAIVYDLTNGQTLYSQNSDASLPLASITKLLTLYAASSVLAPSTPVTMSSTSLAEINDAADAGFKIGETFSFEDIGRLALAASSNAGAEAIIEAADAQRGTDTTVLLASAASQLGLSQTHAVNGTGLDESSELSGGYGSAHDVAVLAGALLQKSPLIARATTQKYVTVTSAQGIAHSFANTDIDVARFPNLLLSKTGYTDLAGGNLVIVYDTGINHPVAIVVLGSTESGRFTDMQELMKATLAHFGGVMPATGKTIP